MSWNHASWREDYLLPSTALLWGENVFGDQFGLDTAAQSLIMLNCEGGKVDSLPDVSFLSFLTNLVLSDPASSIELDLVQAARARGLHPSLSQHLSFELPLMCGGSADASNLEVLDSEAHMAILGQLVRQSHGVPEGTAIHGFKMIKD